MENQNVPQNQQQQETLEVGSTFPAPPNYFKYFTNSNLQLLNDIPHDLPNDFLSYQSFIKNNMVEYDHKNLENVDLRKVLNKPRLDWIEEDGYYTVFGDYWPLKEQLPSLKDSGINQLYPDNLNDKRPALHSLLRSMLMTHFDITKELSAAPPPLDHDPLSNVRNKIEHLRLIGINMHHIINELRPIQAKETLSHLIQQQYDKRKSQTDQIKSKCREIESTLEELQNRNSNDDNNDQMKSQATSNENNISNNALNHKEQLMNLINDI